MFSVHIQYSLLLNLEKCPASIPELAKKKRNRADRNVTETATSEYASLFISSLSPVPGVPIKTITKMI